MRASLSCVACGHAVKADGSSHADEWRDTGHRPIAVAEIPGRGESVMVASRRAVKKPPLPEVVRIADRSESERPKMQSKVRGPRPCSRCRQFGHYAPTCGNPGLRLRARAS